MISAIHTSNVMNVVPSVMSQRRYNAQSGAAKTSVKRADPLSLERIDLQIEIAPLSFEELSKAAPGETSAQIRERVMRARQLQVERYKEHPGIHCNAQMTEKMLAQYCVLDEPTKEVLRQAMVRLNLSARAYSRILKVARTIADLDGKANIELSHIAEAVGYRNLDRSSWGE